MSSARPSGNFVSGKVADQLKTSIGAPAGFVAAAVPALEALSRLSTGSLVITDREVTLRETPFTRWR